MDPGTVEVKDIRRNFEKHHAILVRIYFRKHEKILHFQLFLNTKMAQIVEILPCGQLGPRVSDVFTTEAARASAAMVMT